MKAYSPESPGNEPKNRAIVKIIFVKRNIPKFRCAAFGALYAVAFRTLCVKT